jgi:putative hemolysin
MKNKLNMIILGLIGFSAQAFAGGSSTVGPANPAAVNCVKLGGILEPYQTPAGQGANCVIGEWQLFREMLKRGLTKPHRYGNGAMPNPAAVNCIDIQGTLRTENTPAGQNGLCVIEEWSLFRVINVTREQLASSSGEASIH